ncbi:MAG: trypsin-like peptidase domain-containing protein [Ardenticatenaceae bacterium]|nr:trypsin-like peptidase domain-containing protein [Ardenticatenaceae bacterium]MCB8987025.1 trypsin-like peptidase domain-containing protein [Ardenticatenaceae bacterium]
MVSNAINQQMTAVIERVRCSLVQLTNGHLGSGAGTIWHADGLILTNAHVVQRHAPQVLLADGRSFPSRLLAYDESLDLAALSIAAHNLPTMELGSSRRLRAGDWVIAIGHPWGVVGAASAGTVIDVGVPLELPRYPGDLIQVGLQLRPGHSGGPMVDGNGRLVGINTMIAGPQVGLAIPLHTAKKFLRVHLGRASENS